LEADTVVRDYYTNVLGAVSAGYVTRDDVRSDEYAAQIRTLAGVKLYRKQVNEKVAMLNMFYSAVYAMITGIGKYTQESFKTNDESFFSNYKGAYAAMTGIKPDDTEDDVPEGFREMADMYNYLFT